MADILIAITGLTGIRNASFELAHRLKRRGHGVTLAAPRTLGAITEGSGLNFMAFPEINEHPERAANTPQEALAITDPTVFADHLRSHKPDLLICDVELHEYIITAYGQGVKLLLLSQWYTLWERTGLPYLLDAAVPGVGFQGSRLGLWLRWRRIKFGRLRMVARQARQTNNTNRRSALLAMAEREGFPKAILRWNLWPGPFTYDRLPVLAMVPWEMEFPHSPHPYLHYGGPMVSVDRPEKAVPELAEVYARQQRTGAALLLCTLTTMRGAQDDFLTKLITAVAGRSDWLLVIGLGGQNADFALPEGVDNIFAFAYVPQLEVMAKADLSINHGGIHTIHEAIHFGVPMLVYSGKKSDQNGCAARVHYHGLGLMADRDADGPEDIQNKIATVLNEPACAAAVLRMQASCTQYREEHSAEGIIEALIEGSRPL